MSQTERATNYIFSSFSLVFANRGASRGSSATYDLFSCLFAVLKLFFRLFSTSFRSCSFRSLVQVFIQLLSTAITWHCPHSPTARRPFSSQQLVDVFACRAHSSKPAATAEWDGRTDRLPHTRPIYAGSATNSPIVSYLVRLLRLRLLRNIVNRDALRAHLQTSARFGRAWSLAWWRSAVRWECPECVVSAHLTPGRREAADTPSHRHRAAQYRTIPPCRRTRETTRGPIYKISHDNLTIILR